MFFNAEFTGTRAVIASEAIENPRLTMRWRHSSKINAEAKNSAFLAAW
jgi:hypothetical protein